MSNWNRNEGESRGAQPRHWGGSHANTEWGAGRALPSWGDWEHWWDTHTHGWDTGAGGLGEVGARRRTCGGCRTQTKARVCGLGNVLWHCGDGTPNPREEEEHVEAPARPLQPTHSARLLHSGIFCCWKGSAFTVGRPRDSAAWSCPHFPSKLVFLLSTFHVCDHQQLLGHSWRHRIHLSFNLAKLRNSVDI